MESKISFFIETLSDEVGSGETGEISTVDITGSLTETARAVTFERRWARGQLGPKDSRSELREKERPNRKWSTSQREGRWDTCKRRPKRRILQHMVNWRKCSDGTSGSFKHEAKAKVRARVTLLLDVDHQQETVNMVQALKKKNAEGNPVHFVTRSKPPWHKYVKETCTDPSCDCWHPPDCVKHDTKEGFNFGEKCAFKQFAEQENNKREREEIRQSI